MMKTAKKIQNDGLHVWLVLWKTYSTLERVAHENIAGLGMCLSDFAVLETLLHKGPLPVNTIGPKVGLTSGSISVAVDRLAARGLVERRNHPDDGRTRVVNLTPAGLKLIEPAFARHADAMNAALSGLSESDKETLVTLLKKAGGAGE